MGNKIINDNSDKLQHLISSLNQDVVEMCQKMNLECGAVVVNQCEENREEEFEVNSHCVHVKHMNERGVGNSRNATMSMATAELVLFSDEDIRYETGYANRISKEFSKHPEADIILFNVRVDADRRTYENTDFHKIDWHNYGRYPAYSICAKNEALKKCSVKFSTLFGGGAPYSNGEDSLFLHDCLKAGLKIYSSPVWIGEEEKRPSTWFFGYNEKFFYDRGVLYPFLYGPLAVVFGLRFLLRNKGDMYGTISRFKAFVLLCKGISKGNQLIRESRV